MRAEEEGAPGLSELEPSADESDRVIAILLVIALLTPSILL